MRSAVTRAVSKPVGRTVLAPTGRSLTPTTDGCRRCSPHTRTTRPMARRRGAHERARRGDVASSFPVCGFFTPFASFHVEDDLFECPSCDDPVDAATRRTSLHGWEFTNAKRRILGQRGRGWSRLGDDRTHTRNYSPGPRRSCEHGAGFAMTADARHYARGRATVS